MSADPHATSDQHDSADLAQFGYKQELKRTLGLGRGKEFAPVIAPAGDDAPLVTEAGTPREG